MEIPQKLTSGWWNLRLIEDTIHPLLTCSNLNPPSTPGAPIDDHFFLFLASSRTIQSKIIVKRLRKWSETVFNFCPIHSLVEGAGSTDIALNVNQLTIPLTMWPSGWVEWPCRSFLPPFFPSSSPLAPRLGTWNGVSYIHSPTHTRPYTHTHSSALCSFY